MRRSPAEVICFIRELFGGEAAIPLHEPRLGERELELVSKSIQSTYVSSVGEYVDQFESDLADYLGVPKVVATVNGTAALHVALHALGVGRGDIVITQPLTFVATCNAIQYTGAEPAFVDVDLKTMGMSPQALLGFLSSKASVEGGRCILSDTGQHIKAVVPMHTLGHPANLNALSNICESWGLELIEDAAESLGSQYQGRHVGTFGRLAALSFNGNKIITTGGGGAVVCSSEELGRRIKHLTTTAKVSHPYDYIHDQVAFNYRLPNLNAALGCAQLEKIERFVTEKRSLAAQYKAYFAGSNYKFVEEPEGSCSNYWLNSILCDSVAERDELLKEAGQAGVQLRPAWELMQRLPAFRNSPKADLDVSAFVRDRLVCLPSSSPKGLH